MKIICFHNPEEENGYLSNWYMSEFCIDEIHFTSMEQYMMYKKAMLFHDMKIASKILQTSDVAQIKQLGRAVSGYDENYWNGVRQIVVYQGLMAKFSQNEKLKDLLLSTGDSILAECAVKDRIWGIGLSMKDADRLDKAKWKGQNLLGYALMLVRERLQAKAWEQRKLEELVGIYDGVHQTPDYQDSGIMFLSVENIATLKSEKYISEEAFERDYKVYPEKGDILMTRIGDVGTTNVVETAEKVAFYVSLALLKPNEIDSYFLSNAMKTNAFQKGLRERTLVTAIPQKINKDEIGKIDIFITNNDEEQKKIGAYFSNLDHLITFHQRKHEKY